MSAPGTADEEVDLLVFGSGAAGLTAALTGARLGLQVLLCESTHLFGGTTATSGGSIWVPNAAPIQRNGRTEPIDEIWRYLRGELGPRLNEPILQAFLEAGPKAIEFLEAESEVRFQHAPNPDYHSDHPGGSAYGRNLASVPFDARRLGAAFAQLRPPRPIYMVLGGMMVGRRDVPVLLRPFASWGALRYSLSLVVPHLLSRLRHPRGTRLLIGNALVARFLFSLAQTSAQLRTEHSLVELLRDGERVAGAIVQTPAGRKTIRARRGVVLATGGIAHDLRARQELMAAYPHRHSLAFEGDVGTGVRAARAIGAAIETDLDSPAYWSPASAMRHADGSQTVWIHGHMDRGKPGLIAVDSDGRRFVNEADSYHDFVLAMFRNRRSEAIPRAWLICDHRFIRAYGLGLVRPHYARLGRYLASGYLHRADTLDALAKRIGIDAQGLQQTVERHNRDCASGVDTAFGRGSNALNRFNGDPEQQPNPCLRPIEHAPFYAVAVEPCSIGTTVGLRTDVDANVLTAAGQPIPGLYACGNDMGPALRGTYPAPGVTLGQAITFAYRAALHVAQAADVPASAQHRSEHHV